MSMVAATTTSTELVKHGRRYVRGAAGSSSSAVGAIVRTVTAAKLMLERGATRALHVRDGGIGSRRRGVRGTG